MPSDTMPDLFGNVTHEGRVCTDCGQFKPLSEFFLQHGSTSSGGKPYYRPDCKPCKRAKHAAWVKTPDGRRVVRNGIIARMFGLSPDCFEQMKRSQEGVCDICKQPETKRHRSGTICELSVDHDHETGKVRALLCSACNAALGLFREDPDRMRAAAAYIEHHSAAASSPTAPVDSASLTGGLFADEAF